MDTMRILLTLVCLNIFLFCEGKSITQSECSRTCKPDLENGNYKQQRNGGIVYSCDRPHVSNIPGLQTMRFECKFVPEFGCWELKAANSRFNNPWGPIYLRNITCQPNTECSNPPLPAHVVRDRTVQYEKEVAIQGVVQPRDKFYSGDTFEYKCQDGFSVVEKSISYDYYNYEEDDEADKTMSMTITCDLSGRWNGKEDYELEFEKCEAIICDARRFSDMRNGNITDYKPSYNFREEMRLVCNEGYKPKNGISVVTCTTNSSFDQLILPSFGCEPITCLEPVNPKNGQMRLQGVYVGDKATFECNSGYNLIGSAEWTCQLNGRWDASCIRCESQDSRSHCPAPCIPLGADVVSVEDTFSVGSVLEFVCKSGGQYYSGSKERTCLQNGKWSGTPIDCTGDSLYDENVGVTLLKALEKQVPDSSSAENDTEIMSKTINKGQVGGVDVYFLVDVSGSIDQKKFNATKRFINATLPMLGINSDERKGTRIVLYYFASKSMKLANRSHFDLEQYESYKDAQSLIFTNETLEDIRKKIDSGSGTAIAAALKDIIIDLDTKLAMVSRQLYRQAQQVIILLSDGMFTTDGNPKENANKLKDELGVEIYSIFVGDAAKENFGYQTMKEIASKIENEEHFFAIQDNDDNFNDVLSKMINGVDNIQCGMTQERLTNLRNNESRYEHDANEHAWPWMADLRTNMESKCGGSLIGERWVLTAAHCLEENIISMVHLQKLKQKQVQGIIAIPVAESDCKVHPKYNSSSIPEFKYDIALIKLQQSVVYTPILLPVCLWNETIKNTSNKNVDDYYKKGIHGVATGWGLRSSRKDDKPEVLKQMQMQVQSPEDCTKDLTDKEKRGVDNELMFCAGGQEMVDGVLKYIDTCGGDSGGPFLVEHPLIENKYIQTGIVSFGYGCKQPGKYGFYTKLTEELLEWIKKTMNES